GPLPAVIAVAPSVAVAFLPRADPSLAGVRPSVPGPENHRRASSRTSAGARGWSASREARTAGPPRARGTARSHVQVVGRDPPARPSRSLAGNRWRAIRARERPAPPTPRASRGRQAHDATGWRIMGEHGGRSAARPSEVTVLRVVAVSGGCRVSPSRPP